MAPDARRSLLGALLIALGLLTLLARFENLAALRWIVAPGLLVLAALVLLGPLPAPLLLGGTLAGAGTLVLLLAFPWGPALEPIRDAADLVLGLLQILLGLGRTLHADAAPTGP